MDTRVSIYDRLKTKTTQTVLPDPLSIKQHIRRANLQYYQYIHCFNNWIGQIDPCLSGWTRDTSGTLSPLWFEGKQFPEELTKANPAALPLPAEQSPAKQPPKTKPKRFSALVAKYAMRDTFEMEDGDGCYSSASSSESSDESSSDSSESDAYT